MWVNECGADSIQPKASGSVLAPQTIDLRVQALARVSQARQGRPSELSETIISIRAQALPRPRGCDEGAATAACDECRIVAELSSSDDGEAIQGVDELSQSREEPSHGAATHC